MKIKIKRTHSAFKPNTLDLVGNLNQDEIYDVISSFHEKQNKYYLVKHPSGELVGAFQLHTEVVPE